MPMLQMKLAQTISEEQSQILHQKLGAVIETVFRKPISYVMLSFEQGRDLWMGGKKLEKGAFLDLRVFGSVSDEAADAFAAQACDVLNSVLGIEGRHVYITYQGFGQWGHNGRIF